ncbi:uncharacterized protein LOC143575397 [Bidens hawaiensis]|uniref:uncharacterized protein LOC143575397 n=1 Tax=Bidens hawaiensis TaxID=980011 RepID=UPI00404B2527
MDAVKMLKVTAHDLVDRFIKGVDSKPFPAVLNTLLGKKYAFKIDIKKYNVDRQEKFLGIIKFSDDENIISALEQKFNLDQSDLSGSMHLTTGDSISQDTVNMKDSLSFTGDNTTPESTSISAVVSSSNLKRNLVEVYDDDELEPSNSGTKGPPKSLKCDKEDGR